MEPQSGSFRLAGALFRSGEFTYLDADNVDY